MNTPKIFKDALEVLEKATFHNGVAVSQVNYFVHGDCPTVSLDFSRGDYCIASARMVVKQDWTRRFWLDQINKLGDGGPTAIRELGEFIEDLTVLGAAWETR